MRKPWEIEAFSGADCRPLFWGMLTAFLILGVALPVSQYFPETYPDFIYGTPSLLFQNKSMEVRGIWLAMAGACAVLFYWYRHLKKDCLHFEEGAEVGHFAFLGTVFLILPVIVFSAFRAEVSWLQWGAVGVFFILYTAVRRQPERFTEILAEKLILLGIVTYYAGVSMAAILNLLFSLGRLQTWWFVCLGVIFMGIGAKAAGIQCREIFLERVILLLQVFVPGMLCVFLTDRYVYQGTELVLPWSKGYVLFYAGLMFCLCFEAIWRFWHSCHSEQITNKMSRLVSLSTIVSITIIHAYQTPEYIWQSDFWHAGDTMLAWEQTIRQGLSLYQTYIPNSGLFGMVSSFLQYVVMHGYLLDYNASVSLSYTVFSIITVVPAAMLIGRGKGLLFSILFVLPWYNRMLMILPVILILLLPWLLRRRLLWFSCWMLLGLASFFYYPLNGTGVILGTLPIAGYEAYGLFRQVRESGWKSVCSRFTVLAAGLSVLLSLWALPMVFRILDYSRTMSGQSTWADGMKLYPLTQIPEWFIPWAGRSDGVIWFYDVLYFLIPILAVMLPLWYILCLLRRNGICSQQARVSLFLFFFAIMVALVSYQFTFFELDPYFLMARANPTLYLFFMLLIPWGIVRFLSESRLNVHALFMGGLIGLGCVMSMSVLYTPDMPHVLKPVAGAEVSCIRWAYVVPDGYMDCSEQSEFAFGQGFMARDTFAKSVAAGQVVARFLPQDAPFITDAQVLYAFFNRKVAVPNAGVIVTASHKAQKKNLAEMEKNPPQLVMYNGFYGDFFSLRAFGVQDWLLKHHYVFFHEKGTMYAVAPESYALNGDVEAARAQMCRMNANLFLSPLEATAAAWGNSLSSLERWLVPSDEYTAESVQVIKGQEQTDGKQVQTLCIQLPKAIAGADCDYLYLDLGPADDMSLSQKDKLIQAAGGVSRWNGKVHIVWRTSQHDFCEEQSVECEYINGRLLLPLYLVPNWRFEQIEALCIGFSDMTVPADFHRAVFYKKRN